MSSLLAGPAPTAVKDPKDAGRALESLLVKQLLHSSGMFKGSGAAGSSLHADLFAEAIAEAVVAQGGFGVGDAVAKSLTPGAGVTSPPTPGDRGHAALEGLMIPAAEGSAHGAELQPADRSQALKVYRSRADEVHKSSRSCEERSP
jgi:Rod binding domain-containing protein